MLLLELVPRAVAPVCCLLAEHSPWLHLFRQRRFVAVFRVVVETKKDRLPVFESFVSLTEDPDFAQTAHSARTVHPLGFKPPAEAVCCLQEPIKSPTARLLGAEQLQKKLFEANCSPQQHFVLESFDPFF